MEATENERLREALQRVLNEFDDVDGWPQLQVAISQSPALWICGAVDDEMRDALRRVQKVLRAARGDKGPEGEDDGRC